MEEVPEIVNVIILIASFVSAVIVIVTAVKKVIEKVLNPINENIDTKIKEIDSKIDKIDKENCKDYLVNFLAAMERGEDMDDVQIELAYEKYDHYSKDLKGNSYIHRKWISVMENK